MSLGLLVPLVVVAWLVVALLLGVFVGRLIALGDPDRPYE